MRIKLPVDNGDPRNALQGFFKELLDAGTVDLLYLPMRTPSGTVTPALVSNPEMLIHADPLAPVLPVNGATQVGKLSIRSPRPRVGVVLRSCEMRALVELVKLQQASLEDLVLISIDCAGTYNVPVYLEKEKESQDHCGKICSRQLSKPRSSLFWMYARPARCVSSPYLTGQTSLSNCWEVT